MIINIDKKKSLDCFLLEMGLLDYQYCGQIWLKETHNFYPKPKLLPYLTWLIFTGFTLKNTYR